MDTNDLVDLLATIESGSQVGLNVGVQLVVSRRHDELRDHVIRQIGKLSAFVENNKSKTKIDTVAECVDAARMVERLGAIVPLIDQAVALVGPLSDRRGTRPGSGTTQNSISSSFCVVNEHNDDDEEEVDEPDEIKDSSSSVQNLSTTDDDEEDEPKIDSVVKMEQTLIMENTTGSLSEDSPSSIIIPAPATVAKVEATYANDHSVRDETTSTDDDDDDESETHQLRPPHKLGGSGFDRQMEDLSSNALSSNALGGSSALSSSGPQLSRAQERENILSLARPQNVSESDDDEEHGKAADSSILSSSNLRHIQMGSDITNMTRSNITGLSGRTKSTHLSRPKSSSVSHTPQGIVQQQVQPDEPAQVKPRSMGRGSSVRGRHPPPRALTAFTSSHQQQQHRHQHQQQLRKVPQGHFKETRDTNAIITATIDMETQLKAATAHQADAEHQVVVPRVPVFQKSHKCLDAIVTCSLDGPGLFIAQFHPKIGGQQALKNRYKMMDTFYTDAENERQGAFHKYDAIDEVKLGQYCVYRHKGRFERARVIEKNETSVGLFLIDLGLITQARVEQLASFPHAQYCFNYTLPKLMKLYPRTVLCRLVGIAPNRADERFTDRAVTRFNELVHLTVPLERRNFVRIEPVFPHDLMDQTLNISSSGVVIPCTILAQPEVDADPKSMVEISDHLVKQELVKRFEEDPTKMINSITKLTQSEQIMLGNEQLDAGREEESLTMFDFHYDRDRALMTHPEKPRLNVNKAANILRDLEGVVQVGANDAILNEGGAAYRKQRDVCRAEAKEPGSCRAGNRCDKIHPDGETDQYGELVPKRRIVTSVASNSIAIRTGCSFIIKVLRLDKKLVKGCEVPFLYRIVTDVANDYFKFNELTAANCKQLEIDGERSKLRKHLENIYTRNKSSYKFKANLEMVVVEHFSSESGFTSSSTSSSNTSSSKFLRGCVTKYDAAKGECVVQLIDEGVVKIYKMADVYKMNDELVTYAQQVHPAQLFNVQVKSSLTRDDLARARDEASRLMRLKCQPYFLAEVAEMAPAKKWNETVAELKLSLMDDGAALNPDVASMLLTTAGDCFESNEDDNDMASSSQVHYDIVK